MACHIPNTRLQSNYNSFYSLIEGYVVIRRCTTDPVRSHGGMLRFNPSIDDEYYLQYYKDIATNIYKLEWLQQVNADRIRR